MTIVGTTDMESAAEVAAYFDEADVALTLTEAVELALRSSPTAVVLDSRMGGTRFRAVEAAAVLDRYLPGVVIVLLSESPGRPERLEAEFLGVFFVLDWRELSRLPAIVARGRRILCGPGCAGSRRLLH